jgi:hypothetical protein
MDGSSGGDDDAGGLYSGSGFGTTAPAAVVSGVVGVVVVVVVESDASSDELQAAATRASVKSRMKPPVHRTMYPPVVRGDFEPTRADQRAYDWYMSSTLHTDNDPTGRVLGTSWDAAVDIHAPGMWRRLLAQAPYWQAADASDVAWLRLADSLETAPVDELGPWLDHCAQEALVQVRDCPWRTPSVPLDMLGDGPPGDILDAARDAIRLRLEDAEIAKPRAQPGLTAASERGMDIPWRADGDLVLSPAASWEQTFEADDVAIDLVLFTEHGRRLVGMIRGADLTGVLLRTPAGERECDYESPGWFRALDVPEGPVSVALHLSSGPDEHRVVTEWRSL